MDWKPTVYMIENHEPKGQYCADNIFNDIIFRYLVFLL